MLSPVKRALVSVSNKQGIVDLCTHLGSFGIEILSTGVTASVLSKHQIAVQHVSEYTGFPEIMGGRVKTLHPKIHGGLLGRRGVDDEVMRDHGIEHIDLLVVNLYPFSEQTSDMALTLPEAIEYIDVGGPAMLRAAAKNYQSVAALVDPDDYTLLLDDLKQHGGAISEDIRLYLAQKVFAYTAVYDSSIARYFESAINRSEHVSEPAHSLARDIVEYTDIQPLRYGENPHQKAFFYKKSEARPGSIAAAKKLRGKELSYNNIADADTAWECVSSFSKPACVIVKHANPCGVAVADDLSSAYDHAYKTDPTSAFGGVIAFNQILDANTVSTIMAQQFVELIIAPKIMPECLELETKNVRLLEFGYRDFNQESQWGLHSVSDGILLQQQDARQVVRADLHVGGNVAVKPDIMTDLLFSWHVVKYVKSNAIVYGRQSRTLGIGAGQMSRIYSARIATLKAHEQDFDLRGAVMASDAFFPFRDSVDHAAELGIAAIIQPGGSMRDNEVIRAADEHGIAMVFTKVRHFRH